MIIKTTILCILICSTAFAKLEKLEEQGISRTLFSFKEVCNSFGVKDALLVEKKNGVTWGDDEVPGADVPVLKTAEDNLM